MAYDSYKGAIWVTPNLLIKTFMGIPAYGPTNTILAISDNDSSVLANITLDSMYRIAVLLMILLSTKSMW